MNTALKSSQIQAHSSLAALSREIFPVEEDEGGLEGGPEPTPQPIAAQTPHPTSREEEHANNSRSYASQAPKGPCEPPQACLEDRGIAWEGRPGGYLQTGTEVPFIPPDQLVLLPLDLPVENQDFASPVGSEVQNEDCGGGDCSAEPPESAWNPG